MKIGLKDIKGRQVKLGDIIAVCGWTYDLRNFGKAGKEYQFHTGEVYFEKGKFTAGVPDEYEHKFYNEIFLIVKRGKKNMVKVSKNWDWNYNE